LYTLTSGYDLPGFSATLAQLTVRVAPQDEVHVAKSPHPGSIRRQRRKRQRRTLGRRSRQRRGHSAAWLE